MMMNFEVEIEHLIEVEGIDAGDGHAQGIADEVADVGVPENGGRMREHRTLVGLLNVVLKSHETIFAGFVEQVVHHLQRIDVSLPGKFGAAEDAAHSAGDLFEDVKRIGDEDGADGSPADSDQFGGLKEDAEISVLHEIAADDAAENHDNADDGEHELGRSAQFAELAALRIAKGWHRGAGMLLGCSSAEKGFGFRGGGTESGILSPKSAKRQIGKGLEGWHLRDS